MQDYVLNHSLFEHKIITIIYMNKKNNKISQRNIKVLKMQDDEIEAYCYLRHQVRHFKKENILAADYKH
jgi:predicted DNA-binding transcriptional regulator YafY